MMFKYTWSNCNRTIIFTRFYSCFFGLSHFLSCCFKVLDELLHFVFERGSAPPPPSLALYENGGQEVDEMVERFFLSFFF